MASDGGATGRVAGAGASLDVGVVVADAYEIIHLLGKGGMGAVWAARHLRLPGKRVAIKVLLGGMDDAQALARFRREAEVASRIGHAGIVEVLDFNQLPDGTPYQVLEYLAGESLGARLRRGPLPVETALDYARQIGSALAAAHRAGVVHRDLKPENIFLCPTDAGGVVAERVKVLDFGISKIRGSQTVKTQDQVLIGTPQYMAPEQASGQNAAIDARTDLFALGAIVYEMLAGRPAFSGESVVAVIMNVVTGTPAPLATLAPGVTPAITSAIERALAKKPEARFPDVATFIEALTGKPLQTLGGAVAAGASAAGRVPLSQEELMGATMAPSGAGTPPSPPPPASAPTGGAPTGAAPIAVTTARRLLQIKSPLPFVVAFVFLGGVAFLVAPRAGQKPPAAPWAKALLEKAPSAKAPSDKASSEKTGPSAPVPPAPVPPPPVVAAPAPPSEPAAPPAHAREAAPHARAHSDGPLPDEVRADLDGAEAALRHGDTREAKRLAQHSLLGKRTGRAFSILTRAACRDGDLANARAGLRNAPPVDRPTLVKACAEAGLDLR
jgi:serine/threonine-protein kinase